jgi:hypothetical protein
VIEERANRAGGVTAPARAAEGGGDVARRNGGAGGRVGRADVKPRPVVDDDLVVDEVLVEVGGGVGVVVSLPGLDEADDDARRRAAGVGTKGSALAGCKPAPPLRYFVDLGG